MQLPQIQYRGVESLAKVDVQAEAQSALNKGAVQGAAIESVGSAIKELGFMADRRIASGAANKALRQSARVNELTSQENININDPDIPDSVRNEVISRINKDGTAQDYVNDATGYHVPNYKVNDLLAKFYEDEIGAGYKGLSGNTQRTAYTGFAGADIQKNIESIANNIRSGEIRAGRDDHLERARALSDSGNYLDAVRVLGDAKAMNFMDAEAVAKEQEGFLAQAQFVAGDKTQQAITEAIKAEFNGDEAVVDDLVDQVNNFAQDNIAKGIWNKEDSDKFTRDLNQGLEGAEYRKEIHNTYDAAGSDAAMAKTFSDVGNVPPNFTLDEWYAELVKRRTEITAMNKFDQGLVDKNAKQVKAQQDFINIESKLQNKIPITSSNDIKIYNEWAAQLAPTVKAKGAVEFNNWIMGAIDSSKRVPQVLKDDFEAAIYSDSPVDLLVASQLYNMIKEDNPAVISQLGSIEHIAALSFVARLQDAPEKLENLHATIKSFQSVDPETKKSRQAIYNQNLSDLDKRIAKAVDNVDADFRWLWEKDPTVHADFRANYTALESKLFTVTGDLEQAQSLATDMLKGSWSVSTINGEPEISQLSVESQFGDWGNKQFNDFKATDYPDADAANIRLGVDARTKNPQVGMQISYPVYQHNPDRPYLKIPLYDENNQPVRWTPNYDITQEAKDAKYAEAFNLASDEQYLELFESTYNQLQGEYGDAAPVRVMNTVYQTYMEVRKDINSQRNYGTRGAPLTSEERKVNELLDGRLNKLEDALQKARKAKFGQMYEFGNDKKLNVTERNAKRKGNEAPRTIIGMN